MRFFETDKQFHLLKDDETAPKGCKFYDLDFRKSQSIIVLDEFNLELKSWTGHNRYPKGITQELSISYKGIWFRAESVPREKSKIMDFLNDIKSGGHENKLKALMTVSFKNDTEYCINANLKSK